VIEDKGMGCAGVVFGVALMILGALVASFAGIA
jgi:hypothetical protein